MTMGTPVLPARQVGTTCPPYLFLLQVLTKHQRAAFGIVEGGQADHAGNGLGGSVESNLLGLDVLSGRGNVLDSDGQNRTAQTSHFFDLGQAHVDAFCCGGQFVPGRDSTFL